MGDLLLESQRNPQEIVRNRGGDKESIKEKEKKEIVREKVESITEKVEEDDEKKEFKEEP